MMKDLPQTGAGLGWPAAIPALAVGAIMAIALGVFALAPTFASAADAGAVAAPAGASTGTAAGHAADPVLKTPDVTNKDPRDRAKQDWAGPVLMIIGGLMATIAVLTAAAAVFRKLGIADSGQAMALPGGSVGAIIAVSLVVVFAILAVFFHAQIGYSGVADDFAKQVMTVSGVLVTSVSSFYFGAKTATAAADQASKAANQAANQAANMGAPTSAPNPASVKPATYLAAGASPTTLTIMGQNLNPVINAQLSRSGSDPVPLTNLASNATQVTGQLAVTADMAGAPWDVVIDDGAGATSRLPAAFTITA